MSTVSQGLEEKSSRGTAEKDRVHPGRTILSRTDKEVFSEEVTFERQINPSRPQDSRFPACPAFSLPLDICLHQPRLLPTFTQKGPSPKVD